MESGMDQQEMGMRSLINLKKSILLRGKIIKFPAPLRQERKI